MEDPMSGASDVRRLFDQAKQERFDFSSAPDLITLRKDKAESRPFQGATWAEWSKAQTSFLKRRRRRKAVSKEHVAKDKLLFDLLFQDREPLPLEGNVLDVGGGMGLFREWWDIKEENVFVNHDPGIERIQSKTPQSYRECYPRAFTLPMVFVEGFGEDLPYLSGLFDTCIIAATLDHCVDSTKVLEEAHRCLKGPGGSLFLVQSCRIAEDDAPPPSTVRRLLSYVVHPGRLGSQLYHRVFYPDTHLRQFDKEEMIATLERIGFDSVQTTLLPTTKRVWVFEAKKR